MGKIFTIIALTFALSGCATGCYQSCILGFGPGNPAFTALANAHDNPRSSGANNYTPPLYITNTRGQTVGKISR